MNCMLFHGSGEIVTSPEIRITKYTKDFGYGFYCTKSEEQAERWALKHSNEAKGEKPIVNHYGFCLNAGLKYKSFPEMSDEWLDFIAACRNSRGATPHYFDIVEGPMADDQVWNYVDAFLNGEISREAFWVLARFKHPTHQISFHTQAALKCLSFKKAVEVHD